MDKKEFFDNMAENWDKDKNISPEKYRKIVRELMIKNGNRILDVGTGTGVLIPFFSCIKKQIFSN